MPRKSAANSWPTISLRDCPPGMFLFGGYLGLKTEYQTDGSPDAYCIDSGEKFWGGTMRRAERDELMVTPVKASMLVKRHF